MGHENGAKVAGVHMEGPFIDQAHKGAQPGQYVLAPSIEAYQEMVGEHGKVIRLITIAPEQPGAEKLIHYLKAQGVTVSIGHTGATYEQAKTAFMTGGQPCDPYLQCDDGFYASCTWRCRSRI